MSTKKTNEAEAAVIEVNKARENLKNAQLEARKIFIKIINEKKNVEFRPSGYWRKKLEQKDKYSLSQAVDDEGVGTIDFILDTDMMPRSGRILSISMDEEGMIGIRVQDVKTMEELIISEGDTMDSDLLLEFVNRFAE